MAERDREAGKTEHLSATAAHARRAEARLPHRLSLLIQHRGGAEIVPLAEGPGVVVGRVACDVTIDDVSLSRQHARFSIAGGEVFVEDLGSTNGTQVAGELVERGVVRLGDDVHLGGVTVTVHELAPGEGRRGIAGHARFSATLEDEVTRARTFRRSLALMMVRPLPGSADPLRLWSPHVEALLRPVDRAGVYSDDTLEMLLPEATIEEARDRATKILASAPALACGIALFPDAATSPEALLAECRGALRLATASDPLRVSKAEAVRGGAPSARREAGPIAENAAMRSLLETAARVARGTIPLMLLGETGTGKEVLARYVHESGSRRDKPFLCVNCAALPAQLVESTLFGHEKGSFTGATQQQKGVFEAADGGTVFLDEIGELPPAAQAALLRVLETKRFTRVGSTREIAVDVRVLCATHRDLDAMSERGEFRQDLLYRLNTVTLRTPPLRDRREDIPSLARHFLEQANHANGTSLKEIDPEAIELLAAYRWPGNVRELKNALDRAVAIAHGPTITIDDLPERVQGALVATHSSSSSPRVATPASAGEAGAPDLAASVRLLEGDYRTRMEKLEAVLLTEALREAGWNQSETARQLQMPLRTLTHKLKMYGIKRPE